VNKDEDTGYESRVTLEPPDEGVDRVERIDGNPVTIHGNVKSYSAVWFSGSKIVKIVFYRAAFYSSTMGEQRARAAEAPPEVRRELLRQYLLKYPSSE
jgi:hypothetical protein